MRHRTSLQVGLRMEPYVLLVGAFCIRELGAHYSRTQDAALQHAHRVHKPVVLRLKRHRRTDLRWHRD